MSSTFLSTVVKTLFLLVGCYVAFVLHVALLGSAAAAWVPNLTLAAGLAAGRSRFGIIWPALAGLLCDSLYARPLGTTMLTATLVVTVGRQWRALARPTVPRSSVGQVFVAPCFAILVIELVSRLLAGFAAGDVAFREGAVTSLTITATTAAATALVLLAVHGGLRLAERRRPRSHSRNGSRMNVRSLKRV